MHAKATGLWVPCELTGKFGDPVTVTDVRGRTLTVERGQMGFCDAPVDKGSFAMRPAILGAILSHEGKTCLVQFADGQKGRFAVFAEWQYEFPSRRRAA